jgi:hypothetical protein
MWGRRVCDRGRAGSGGAGLADGAGRSGGGSRFPNRNAKALRPNRGETDLNLRRQGVRAPHGQPPARAGLGLALGQAGPEDHLLDAERSIPAVVETRLRSLRCRASWPHCRFGAGNLAAADRVRTVPVYSILGVRQLVGFPAHLARSHDGPVRNKNGPIVRRAVCRADHPQPRPCVHLRPRGRCPVVCPYFYRRARAAAIRTLPLGEGLLSLAG